MVPGATPYTMTVPRRIPIHLREVIRVELSKLKEQGVIHLVDEPTKRCAGLAVVPKPAGVTDFAWT